MSMVAYDAMFVANKTCKIWTYFITVASANMTCARLAFYSAPSTTNRDSNVCFTNVS